MQNQADPNDSMEDNPWQPLPGERKKKHRIGEMKEGYKNVEVYPIIDPRKIGICFIFNHKKFEPKLKLDERSGTTVDAEELELIFKHLKFDVYRFNDYSYIKIFTELQEAVKNEDYKKYSCFVCCILSYGTADFKLYASDQSYPIQTIYKTFEADSSPFITGKPKIFFIQACPDNKMKSSVNQSTDSGIQVSYKIPTNADFLIVYSTVPGRYSWDNSNDGSWFIDALCLTVRKYASDMDLFQLLSIVNCQVSLKCINANLKVEVPCVTSTLTRDIKFLVEQSLEYEFEKRDAAVTAKIGKVVIFNHKMYDNDPENKFLRKGTELDAKKLKKIFHNFDFEVEVNTDKNKDDILKIMKIVADGPHENYGCFICCVLTHGSYGTLKASDVSYKIEDIFSPFYDKWNGKPKIYFIQACQGDKYNFGFQLHEKGRHSTENQRHSTERQRDSTDFSSQSTDSQSQSTEICGPSTDSEEEFNFRHLTHPDFLIVSSTTPGYSSFQNKTCGSWFIQKLFEAFTQYAESKEFLQLLTITNRNVAQDCESSSKESRKNRKKQTLCLTSTLTRAIDFKHLKQRN